MTEGIQPTSWLRQQAKKYSEKYVTCNIAFNEKQAKMNEHLAKRLGTDDLRGIIERGISIAKILVSGLDQGCELIMVNTTKTKIVETKDGKLALVGTKENIKFVTEEMKEAMEFQEDIDSWNAYGMPINSIPC